jgi:hypothetical protein
MFFNGHFYLPAALALLPDLLQVLRHGGSANIELLALGAHLPLTHGAQLNRMPSHILLGRSWLLRRPIAAATAVFIDNLGRLLARVDNVNIGESPMFGVGN